MNPVLWVVAWFVLGAAVGTVVLTIPCLIFYFIMTRGRR